MTAKEYLEQLEIYNKVVEAKLREVEHYKAFTMRVTQVWDGLPLDKQSRGSAMEQNLVRLADESRELDIVIDRFCDLRDEISDLLKKLSNPMHQVLLRTRYLQFKSWREVAVEMGFSLQHIYRLAREAHTEFDNLLGEIES